LPHACTSLTCLRVAIARGRYAQLPVAFVDDWSPEAITEPKLRTWRDKLAPRFDNASSEGWARLEWQLTGDYWWDRLTRGTSVASRPHERTRTERVLLHKAGSVGALIA
jgi:hypothetical protein